MKWTKRKPTKPGLWGFYLPKDDVAEVATVKISSWDELWVESFGGPMRAIPRSYWWTDKPIILPQVPKR